MKPINMKTREVRAILDNRKTATRRVVKPQPVWNSCEMRWYWKKVGWWYDGWDPIETITWKNTPYRPGDILYVRETWKQATCDYAGGGYGLTDVYLYKADEPINNTGMMVEEKWHPSIHMPREAARIFLRVTDVRVERLQNITELDILEKEGVTVDFPQPKPSYISLAYTETRLKPAVKKAFANLWNSTLKPKDRALYGWEANPWVWVIEFERCEKPKGD